MILIDAKPSVRHLAALLEYADVQQEKLLCFSNDYRLTYKDASLLVRRLASWLVGIGVRPGDRIVILTKNRPEVLLAMLSASRIGAIFTVLHYSIRGYGLQQILEQVQPSAAFLDETTMHLAEEFSGIPIILTGQQEHVSEEEQPKYFVNLNTILQEHQSECSYFEGNSLDPACLIFTSGSTGSPKGVVLSHDNILFVINAIQERLNYLPSDVIGLFLPLSFDYGLYQIFLAIQAGASLFMGSPELAGTELLLRLENHRISVLPGVPTLIANMLKLLNRKPQPLHHLRAITNTGSHLSHQHVQELQTHLPDAKIFLMYGLTECKRVSILLPEERELHPGSVGRPLTGTEVAIVDENGKLLPPRERGELLVWGRHVAAGYWQAEQETLAKFSLHSSGQVQVLHTGDICCLDEEGFIYFFGRKDALIKHHGYRIHPLEIEIAACSLQNVREAAVVHICEGDKLHLFITLSAPDNSLPHIRDELRQKLEPFKVPDKIHVLPEMPKTNHGKLDYAKLTTLT